jgi:cobalt-zinc-cadmium efflux system membrane fusion protein
MTSQKNTFIKLKYNHGLIQGRRANPTYMKSIHFFLTLLMLNIILLTSCTPGSEQAGEQTGEVSVSAEEVTLTAEQVKILDLSLGKIEKRQISNVIKVNGMLDVPPQNMVTISAPLGGFIKYTELLQGMRVKKGQVLATMEDPAYIQLQQDYIDSKSQLEFLELEYNRQQQLAAENVNAAKTLQQSKSNYLSTKAKVEGLRARLELIHLSPQEIEKGEIKSSISVLSPISGYVTQVHVNIGMYVQPADVMFKIVDTEHLHAEAQVFEKDLSKLKVGQHVLINLTNESTPRHANVYLIGKEISDERTVRVHCHLNKEDPNLIPGMYFSALIEIGEEAVNTVPENAVVSFEGTDYLFFSKGNNNFGWVEVKTGAIENGYSEVILPEGFDMNASIVVHGAYALLSKVKNVEE